MGSLKKSEEIPFLGETGPRNTITFFNFKPPKKPKKKRVVDEDEEFDNAVKVNEGEFSKQLSSSDEQDKIRRELLSFRGSESHHSGQSLSDEDQTATDPSRLSMAAQRQSEHTMTLNSQNIARDKIEFLDFRVSSPKTPSKHPFKLGKS